jgi:hypothetical protein
MAENGINIIGYISINSGGSKLEAYQCIDIILSDFQVLKKIYIRNISGSKLESALRNKKAM